MNYLFENLDKVKDVVLERPFGLIFDVDGTIAEIAPTAEAVKVAPAVKEHLASLVPRLSLVSAISGRLIKVLRELVGVEGVVYNGNHGLEKWVGGKVEVRPEAQAYVAKIQAVIGELGPVLQPRGVRFEDKGAGLVFHYRTLPDREEVRDAILQAISRSPAAQPFNIDKARTVIELRPPLEISKGSVLRELIAGYNLKSAVYLGDDVADIGAFNVMRELSGSGQFAGLALGVIGEETPPDVADSVDFILRGVNEVETFLSWLVETIPPGSN